MFDFVRKHTKVLMFLMFLLFLLFLLLFLLFMFCIISAKVVLTQLLTILSHFSTMAT